MANGFRAPHWSWWVLILTGMGLTAWIAFSPLAYDFWRSHITALLPQVVFQWIFWSALLAHVGEAMYAWRLASQRDSTNVVRWGIQTFLLGYPSLSLLKALPSPR